MLFQYLRDRKKRKEERRLRKRGVKIHPFHLPWIRACTIRSVANLKCFKIASLNVNILLKHSDEIRHILLSTPFDIFAINKSKIDVIIYTY